MINTYQKFGFYNDPQMVELVTDIHMIQERGKDFPVQYYTFYFGSPYKWNFMYSQEDKDIIITHGTQIFNLGKYIKANDPIQLDIRVEEGVEPIDISPTYVEWLPPDAPLDTRISWCALVTNHQLRLDYYVKKL